MRWLWTTCLFLGACHLAEAADPPSCQTGTHPQGTQCVPDPLKGPVVTIASCVLTPASLTVPVNGDFSFDNHDAADHAITGDDGKVWAIAKAGLASSSLGITKPGTWRYHVSDCPNGGSIVVE